MRVGSLFSGIGGLELGLEQAGMEVIWQSEIDDFACKVLEKHWPDVPNLGDITTVDWSQVEPVDLICGGFPCQDISVAGKGAGIKEGTRSGLWFEFRNAIRVLRPRYVVIENVRALLVRGGDIVLGDLAGLGYDAEWAVLRAADFGAPHRRDRVFIVAYAQGRGRRIWDTADIGQAASKVNTPRDNSQDTGRHPQHGPELADTDHDGTGAVGDTSNFILQGQWPGGEQKSQAPAGEGLHHSTGRELGDTAGEGLPQPRCAGQPQGETQEGTGLEPERQRSGRILQPPRRSHHWDDGEVHHGADGTPRLVKPGLRILAHGVPDRVAKLRALGNAVVPAVAEHIGHCIMAWEARNG